MRAAAAFAFTKVFSPTAIARVCSFAVPCDKSVDRSISRKNNYQYYPRVHWENAAKADILNYSKNQKHLLRRSFLNMTHAITNVSISAMGKTVQDSHSMPIFANINAKGNTNNI